jgi:hypothetical protein
MDNKLNAYRLLPKEFRADQKIRHGVLALTCGTLLSSQGTNAPELRHHFWRPFSGRLS